MPLDCGRKTSHSKISSSGPSAWAMAMASAALSVASTKCPAAFSTCSMSRRTGGSSSTTRMTTPICFLPSSQVLAHNVANHVYVCYRQVSGVHRGAHDYRDEPEVATRSKPDAAQRLRIHIAGLVARNHHSARPGRHGGYDLRGRCGARHDG